MATEAPHHQLITRKWSEMNKCLFCYDGFLFPSFTLSVSDAHSKRNWRAKSSSHLRTIINAIPKRASKARAKRERYLQQASMPLWTLDGNYRVTSQSYALSSSLMQSVQVHNVFLSISYVPSSNNSWTSSKFSFIILDISPSLIAI